MKIRSLKNCPHEEMKTFCMDRESDNRINKIENYKRMNNNASGSTTVQVL